MITTQEENEIQECAGRYGASLVVLFGRYYVLNS